MDPYEKQLAAWRHRTGTKEKKRVKQTTAKQPNAHTDTDVEKVALSLGWMRGERLGREVWHDPTGGHVAPNELPAAINAAIDQMVSEGVKPLPEDMLALMKRGNPFTDPRKN